MILISVQDSLLACVRTGTHSRRLRLVLDLRTKTTPKFSVQQQQYLVTVALTASGGESSAPFSYVLFTLPGRTVSTQSQPPVAAPSPTTPPVQEAKTRVPVDPLAPPQTVEPAKTRENEIPPADQVKKSEKPGVGGKKVVPEQVKAQEKPSPLLQPSPVSKPAAEKNRVVQKSSGLYHLLQRNRRRSPKNRSLVSQSLASQSLASQCWLSQRPASQHRKSRRLQPRRRRFGLQPKTIKLHHPWKKARTLSSVGKRSTPKAKSMRRSRNGKTRSV